MTHLVRKSSTKVPTTRNCVYLCEVSHPSALHRSKVTHPLESNKFESRFVADSRIPIATLGPCARTCQMVGAAGKIVKAPPLAIAFMGRLFTQTDSLSCQSARAYRDLHQYCAYIPYEAEVYCKHKLVTPDIIAREPSSGLPSEVHDKTGMSRGSSGAILEKLIARHDSSDLRTNSIMPAGRKVIYRRDDSLRRLPFQDHMIALDLFYFHRESSGWEQEDASVPG